MVSTSPCPTTKAISCQEELNSPPLSIPVAMCKYKKRNANEIQQLREAATAATETRYKTRNVNAKD
jgi:hypothetical protein